MIKEIQYKSYSTFEEKEQRFRESIFNIVPRKYAGVPNFWIDFSSNFINISNDEISTNSYITSTPSDCIAFATPFQTINAAILSIASNQDEGLQVINDFRLYKIRKQPIQTLSGGESVRLALAKSFIFSKQTKGLIISSPFIWLDNESYSLFQNVANKFTTQNKTVELLILDGETDNTPDNQVIITSKINFSILFSDVEIDLKPNIDIGNSSGNRKATINDCNIKLISPCIMKGENGSGKSLISLVLSRVISYSGLVAIKNNGKLGFSRMLFQDVITQTLQRNFEKIIYFSGISREKILKVYNDLLLEFSKYFKNKNLEVPIISHDERIGNKTIVEIKFLLLAVRIIGNPTALILDEPGWGLTKDNSIAFVNSIISVAHTNLIPVIIVSHKKWYDNISKSELLVTKQDIDNNSFTINITKENHE